MPVLRKHRTTTGGMVRDTIVFTVAESRDDCYTFDGDVNATGVSAISSELLCNDISAGRFDYRSAALLTNLDGRGIPGNATNIVADFFFTAKGGNNGAIRLSRMGFEKALSPSRITLKSELGINSGRPRTVLKTWGPNKGSDWVDNAVFQIDLSAQVAEVRALGSAVITRFNWLWLPLEVGYNGGSNYHIYSFDGDPAKAPHMNVSFDVPA